MEINLVSVLRFEILIVPRIRCYYSAPYFRCSFGSNICIFILIAFPVYSLAKFLVSGSNPVKHFCIFGVVYSFGRVRKNIIQNLIAFPGENRVLTIVLI